MQFEEKPDYNYLRGLFKQIMARHDYTYDYQFDWIIKKEGGAAKLKEIIAQEAKAQPEPAANVTRAASKNRFDREERKINIGQQIVTGQTQRPQQLPPKA